MGLHLSTAFVAQSHTPQMLRGGEELSDQPSECTMGMKIAAIHLQHHWCPLWEPPWSTCCPLGPVSVREGNLAFWHQKNPFQDSVFVSSELLDSLLGVFFIPCLLYFIQIFRIPIPGYWLHRKWGKRGAVLLDLSPSRLSIKAEVSPAGGKLLVSCAKPFGQMWQPSLYTNFFGRRSSSHSIGW